MKMDVGETERVTLLKLINSFNCQRKSLKCKQHKMLCTSQNNSSCNLYIKRTVKLSTTLPHNTTLASVPGHVSRDSE